MKEQKRNLMLKELDEAKQIELDYKIDVHDLLIDLKILMKDYYVATFTETGNELIVAFNNGQKFKITMSEQ